MTIPTASQIPRVNDIIGAGSAAIIAARPHTADYLSTGRYGDVVAMERAQIVLCLKRLADECKAARVPLAEGRSLRDLLASEFDAVTDPAPQKAIGTVLLTRTYAGTTMPAGLIRAGTRFHREADPTASPPILSADYETVEPVFVASKGTMGTQSMYLRIQALQPGTAANIQPTDPVLTISTPLFYPNINWGVSTSRAAGGSDGVSTAKLRSLALAMATGQYGPTQLALVAGTLLTNGVSHCVVKEYDDSGYPTYRGTTSVWFCDDSWCWSPQLAETVRQNLYDEWLGFGCKATVNEVTNIPISLAVTVMLRTQRDLSDTIEISNNIRAAIKAYFNDRPDWYTFKIRGIVGSIVRADRRILRVVGSETVSPPCITIKSISSGSTVTEPAGGLPVNPVDYVRHYEIDDANVEITYTYPT